MNSKYDEILQKKEVVRYFLDMSVNVLLSSKHGQMVTTENDNCNANQYLRVNIFLSYLLESNRQHKGQDIKWCVHSRSWRKALLHKLVLYRMTTLVAAIHLVLLFSLSLLCVFVFVKWEMKKEKREGKRSR